MIKKLHLIFTILIMLLLVGCKDNSAAKDDSKSLQEYNPVGSLELKYATGFSIDYYEEGYRHIHIMDGSDYIIVPEGMDNKDFGLHNVAFIKENPSNIYLAASSAMDLFKELDALENVKECSTKAEDYSDPVITDMINNNEIVYVGKYSAPDTETLLANDCKLAIESTMINHTPKIKEQLESLNIPVLTEYSSYEEHPLGRLEWIKLYGALTGKTDEAEAFFAKECEKVENVMAKISTSDKDRPSVAFFYISSNGYVNVRKPGDYFSRMIDIAGGSYALSNLQLDEENALSTVNITMEDFYREAKEADILIYNSTITGNVASIDELLDKSPIFADFEAVKNKRVYCTTLNLFQDSSKVADIIYSLHNVINNKADGEEYFYRIE